MLPRIWQLSPLLFSSKEAYTQSPLPCYPAHSVILLSCVSKHMLVLRSILMGKNFLPRGQIVSKDGGFGTTRSEVEWALCSAQQPGGFPLEPASVPARTNWRGSVVSSQCHPNGDWVCQKLCCHLPHLCSGLLWVQLQLDSDWTRHGFLLEEELRQKGLQDKPCPGIPGAQGQSGEAELANHWDAAMGKSCCMHCYISTVLLSSCCILSLV